MKGSRKTVFILSFMCVSLIVDTAAYGQSEQGRRSRKNSIETSLSKFSGSWKFSFSGSTLKDEISKGTGMALSSSVKLNYQFMKSLKLHAEPTVSFKSGHAQSLYGEFEQKNTIGANEALINWTPHNMLEINAGILGHSPEKRIGNPFLINGAPFPGLEGRIHILNSKEFKLSMIMEEAIPTSYTMDFGVEEMEETPHFGAQSINLKYGQEDNQFRIHAVITRFQFDNLPSIVAQKSRTRGNTVIDGYHFDYKFSGISASADSSYKLTNSFDTNIFGRYLKNSNASNGLNIARSFGFKLSYLFSNDFILTPSVEKFRSEPDAAPAYYSSYNFGLNNRQGYIYGLKLKFVSFNFQITGNYLDSDLVYRSSLQAKRSGYSIKLETLDVEF